LRVLGERVRLALEDHPGVTHAFASIEGGKPKFWLEAGEDKARLAGLTLNDIALQFQTQLEGITGGTVLEDLEEIPVRVRNHNETRSDLARIASLEINSPVLEDWIPASALGEIVLKPEITSITRRNGERVNNIEAFLHPYIAPIDVTGAILKDLEDSGFVFPAGYRLEIAGDADAQAEAIGQLLTYAPVLLVVMVSTLILAFRSLALAGIIGGVAALSAGLGFLSLGISGFPIGFNPLIGTAGLVGVAINGSIVVLAAIRADRKASSGDVDAIIRETMGSARHILSTAFTTVAGFMPLLLSGGTFWPPLAVVIAGGVGFSVILSLYFTPAIYALISGAKEEVADSQPEGVPA
jgi:multidrug efflux pump subunit AcrB